MEEAKTIAVAGYRVGQGTEEFVKMVRRYARLRVG
jgi:hypothetical protein